MNVQPDVKIVDYRHVFEIFLISDEVNSNMSLSLILLSMLAWNTNLSDKLNIFEIEPTFLFNNIRLNFRGLLP